MLPVVEVINYLYNNNICKKINIWDGVIVINEDKPAIILNNDPKKRKRNLIKNKMLILLWELYFRHNNNSYILNVIKEYKENKTESYETLMEKCYKEKPEMREIINSIFEDEIKYKITDILNDPSENMYFSERTKVLNLLDKNEMKLFEKTLNECYEYVKKAEPKRNVRIISDKKINERILKTRGMTKEEIYNVCLDLEDKIGLIRYLVYLFIMPYNNNYIQRGKSIIKNITDIFLKILEIQDDEEIKNMLNEKIYIYIEYVNSRILRGSTIMKDENNNIAIVNKPRVVRIKENNENTDILIENENSKMIVHRNKINKYWENNTEIEIFPDEIFGDEINILLTKILDTNLFENFLEHEGNNKTFKVTDEKILKSMSLNEKINNVENCLKYLKSVGYEYENDIFEKRKFSGKLFEYNLCGENNEIAKQIFNKNEINIQSLEHIVNDIHENKIKNEVTNIINSLKSNGVKDRVLTDETSYNTSSSTIFCHDNIDIKNKMVIELKDYHKNGNNVMKYNLNMEFKKIYANELKSILENTLMKYLIEENEDEKEKLFISIKEQCEILYNKKKFEKKFYKNNFYYGFAVTINKFNTIEIPENYNENESANSLENILLVKRHQNQIFTPIMEDKYIVGYKKLRGLNIIANELMSKHLTKEIFNGEKFKFLITVWFKYGIGVYNYTEDELVDDNFILGTYKTSFTNARDSKYNAVLIPIEKFKIF